MEQIWEQYRREVSDLEHNMEQHSRNLEELYDSMQTYTTPLPDHAVDGVEPSGQYHWDDWAERHILPDVSQTSPDPPAYGTLPLPEDASSVSSDFSATSNPENPTGKPGGSYLGSAAGLAADLAGSAISGASSVFSNILFGRRDDPSAAEHPASASGISNPGSQNSTPTGKPSAQGSPSGQSSTQGSPTEQSSAQETSSYKRIYPDLSKQQKEKEEVFMHNLESIMKPDYYIIGRDGAENLYADDVEGEPNFGEMDFRAFESEESGLDMETIKERVERFLRDRDENPYKPGRQLPNIGSQNQARFWSRYCDSHGPSEYYTNITPNCETLKSLDECMERCDTCFYSSAAKQCQNRVGHNLKHASNKNIVASIAFPPDSNSTSGRTTRSRRRTPKPN